MISIPLYGVEGWPGWSCWFVATFYVLSTCIVLEDQLLFLSLVMPFVFKSTITM